MIRTGYSFRTAYGHLEDVLDRLKEIGWPCAVMADRNNTFGYNRWTQGALAKGLRPVYGVELAVCPDLEAAKPIVDYWWFMAQGSLEPLHDLLWLASSQSRTFPMGGHEPLLTYEQALAASGVTKIGGSRLLLGHVVKRERQDLFSFNDITTAQQQDLGCCSVTDFYVGLSPSTPKALYKAAKAEGLSFCCISDNVYPAAEDKDAYQVALGKRAQLHVYPQHILSDAELKAALWTVSESDFCDGLANRDKILSQSTAEMKKASILVPQKTKSLRELCVEGAAKKGCDLADPVYAERLERELKLIEEKRFEDYFHVVSDFMHWAKRRMVVGPGRGSSSGSLVCYFLDITVADPVKYDLVFERFIDITRADYPDIDVDLSDDRREQVFQYLEDHYGKDRVARLGTVAVYQSKSALKAAAMAIGVPQWMVDAASNSVITRSKGDSRADYKIEDTFTMTDAGKRLVAEYKDMRIAGEIEAHPQFRGQHAAGIVMTNDPVRKFVAVDAHNKIAMVDWQDAKDLDLLKVDILGLTQLSIFESCLQKLGLPDVSGYLEGLPLDDQAAFDVLNQRKLAGIFQFQGGTTNSVVHQIDKITEFEDIVSITALCRPGPLGSGGTQSWVNRKNGVEQPSVYHEAFKPYLESTYGIMVYQEQVMRICREIGGMSWADVTALRKAMGKSMGMEYFDSYRDKYLPSALAKGIPKEAALKMWDGMCSFGMYAFNRAHALAYGMITYYCCWLKAHYPLEFAAATLDAENEPNKQIQILRELRDEGIDYVPVDVKTSTAKWTVRREGNKSIVVGPLTLIDGIGPAAAEKILEWRSGGSEIGDSLRAKLEVPKTAIDSLYPIRDAVKKKYPDLAATPKPNIQTKPTPVNKVYETRAGREVVVIGVLVRNHPLNENEPARVARRGYAVRGRTEALNLHLRDDTGDIFCKVSRHMFPKIGHQIVNGKALESIYAIKGTVPEDFRMVWVEQVRYLGEINGTERDLDMASSSAPGDGEPGADGISRLAREDPRAGERASAGS
jgi:DNA-directed DNA polymerase III PolC